MYKSRKKKNMIKLSGIALLAALTVGIGSTGAVIRHQVNLKNEISTDTVEVEVEEELKDDNPDDWTKPKKVSFKNPGSADVFLRVTYSETWTAEDGTLLSNKMPDESKDVASKIVNSQNWEYNEADGWYYYKKVLPAGSTTESFMEQVDFSNIDSLEESLKNTYKGAEYEIHFQAEAVQASDEWKVSEDAAAALFDKDISAAVNDGATIIDRDQNEDQWPSNKDTAKIIWSVGTAGGGN
ncbi:MAG: hypothetical protein KH353_08535 [Clostridium sp.]|nr:hypothetical protein [Clostridium sp.]